MQAEELDASYTELCRALGRVGEPRAPLLLALLCLALMARQGSAREALAAIAQAEAACA